MLRLRRWRDRMLTKMASTGVPSPTSLMTTAIESSGTWLPFDWIEFDWINLIGIICSETATPIGNGPIEDKNGRANVMSSAHGQSHKYTVHGKDINLRKDLRDKAVKDKVVV